MKILALNQLLSLEKSRSFGPGKMQTNNVLR